MNGEGKKVLRLTLIKAAFDVMKTGEKTCEFRKASPRMMSRLLVNGNPAEGLREYDEVLFVNGYSSSSPRFSRKYKGARFSRIKRTYTYSNGLTVEVEPTDIIIFTEVEHEAE